MDRPKRKRIEANRGSEVVDEMSWIQNCTSGNVRHHSTHTQDFHIEFWYDKHYWDRVHQGDANGDRVGIEFENVEPLIIKSFKHLGYYASKKNDFYFINHPPQQQRNIRVVLRQNFDDKDPLNVVVEYHFINLNLLEVTIVTAMTDNNFKIGDGQYGIEFVEDDSKLVRLVNKKLIDLDEYKE